MHVYIYIHIYIYIYMYIYIYTRTCIYTFALRGDVFASGREANRGHDSWVGWASGEVMVHTSIHPCIHAFIDSCIHTNITILQICVMYIQTERRPGTATARAPRTSSGTRTRRRTTSWASRTLALDQSTNLLHYTIL